MAIDKTVIQKYLQAAIGMNPVEVTYSGRVYDGLKSARDDSVELKISGLMPSYKYSVHLDLIALTNWDAIPAIGETVSVGGTTFRILDLGNDPADVYIRLDLGSQYA